MPIRGWRAEFTRYGAPAAFLAAVTVAVLLVRAGLSADEGARIRTVTRSVVGKPAAPRPSAASPRSSRRHYRIKGGDTLEGVAAKFDVSVDRILELNPGIDPTALRIGQRIRVA